MVYNRRNKNIINQPQQNWHSEKLLVSSNCILHKERCGNNDNNHHHHVALAKQISLTLSRHPSLSSIAPGSILYRQCCCIKVQVSCPNFAYPCEVVNRSISLMSSSLLLQQCTPCLVRLSCIVLEMGGLIATVFLGADYSSTCSELLAAFLCNCHQAFSPYV